MRRMGGTNGKGSKGLHSSKNSSKKSQATVSEVKHTSNYRHIAMMGSCNLMVLPHLSAALVSSLGPISVSLSSVLSSVRCHMARVWGKVCTSTEQPTTTVCVTV